MDLADSRIAVLGGGRRLGRSIAVDLAAHGCSVAVVARGEAADVVAEIERCGSRGVALRADLSDATRARAVVAEAAEALGGLDGIVYAASGGFTATPLGAIDEALVEEALGAAVRGLLFATQAAEATLSDGGAIVVIGDVAGVRGWPSYLPHSAAKGAQRALVQGLARALAPRLRINLVHPGTVLPPDDLDEGAVARIAERIPLGRIGEPADICAAVRYLLGADYVTGTELVVDGGRLAT